MLLALLLSSFIGLSLGLLGGGGSIITVPILIYALHVSAKSAIAMSLAVVGVTSAGAAITHARAGNVRWRVAALFGGAGMAGAFAGGQLAQLVPGWLLLSGFGAMMLLTAAAMLRGRKPSRTTDEGAMKPGRALLDGMAVGLVTGMVGAGGGFLVVPALVLLGGLPMHAAIGTSLVVFSMKSFAGFAGYLGHVSIDWPLTALMSAAAIAGSAAGGKLSARVPQERLRQGFAWFVVVMGVFLLGRQIPAEAWASARALVSAHRDWALALGGGLLIGLAAALLLLVNGRIAGVSGIAGGLVAPARGDVLWRALFVAGLVLGGAVMGLAWPALFSNTLSRSLPAIALAGLLVGIGTRLGNGCTSGHGVCGVSRFSPRSIAATATFIATGAFTTWIINRLLGGSL
ncbi:TSUP family transporter [Sorangium sp. So ce1000]|uniref:TSUP family transporter n=1 Tax=Sorangium sp. So ce1000 TaxID=3133325 RepID=UPI003F5E22AF